MNDLFFIFINLFFMYIWFNTDAFIEYCRYIRYFSYKFKVKEYLSFRDKYPNISYHAFLILNYNNFFIRLITCPSCLGVWLNFVTVLFYNNKAFFFSNFALNMILYYILAILKNKYDRINNF
jgi:hypothetical protein